MAQGTVQVTHTGTSRWRRRTGEYGSLTAALEAAADGDVLTVAPGTYRENLVIARAVTLRGPEGSVGSVRIAPVDGVPLTLRASAVVSQSPFLATALVYVVSRSPRIVSAAAVFRTTWPTPDPLSQAEGLLSHTLDRRATTFSRPCVRWPLHRSQPRSAARRLRLGDTSQDLFEAPRPELESIDSFAPRPRHTFS